MALVQLPKSIAGLLLLFLSEERRVPQPG